MMTTSPNVTPAPQTDPLERLLDAFAPMLRRKLLPPLELVRRHDDELAQLIEVADRLHGRAAELAREWQRARPGGADFALALVSGNATTIEHALVHGQAHAFAIAYAEQVRAHEADDRVRAHAARATKLLEELDRLTDQIAEEAGARFEEAHDRKDRRVYEDALALCAEWRSLVALFRWLQNPALTFRALPPNAIPESVSFREWDASGAISGEPYSIVPIDASDAPRARRPGLPLDGGSPRRGLFGR